MVGDETGDIYNLSSSTRIRVGCSLGYRFTARHTAPRLEHMTTGVPSDDPDSLEVDLQHILPVFVGEIFSRGTSLNTAAYT